MTIVGCVCRSGMLAPPCAAPVKVEVTVPVGAFPTALADIILFAPPVVAADSGTPVSIHARISVTSGRSVREGNRTSGRIGRKGSDRVKRGYVRSCHFPRRQ